MYSCVGTQQVFLSWRQWQGVLCQERAGEANQAGWESLKNVSLGSERAEKSKTLEPLGGTLPPGWWRRGLYDRRGSGVHPDAAFSRAFGELPGHPPGRTTRPFPPFIPLARRRAPSPHALGRRHFARQRDRWKRRRRPRIALPGPAGARTPTRALPGTHTQSCGRLHRRASGRRLRASARRSRPGPARTTARLPSGRARPPPDARLCPSARPSPASHPCHRRSIARGLPGALPGSFARACPPARSRPAAPPRPRPLPLLLTGNFCRRPRLTAMRS